MIKQETLIYGTIRNDSLILYLYDATTLDLKMMYHINHQLCIIYFCDSEQKYIATMTTLLNFVPFREILALKVSNIS